MKQTSAPKRAAPQSDASPETPANKMAKPSFGGNQTRAQECVICQRPRDREQRGRACPTCQSIMRGQGQRSIEVVLAQKDLCKNVREQSLDAKPIDNPDDGEQQAQIDQIEKLLKNLKRLKRMRPFTWLDAFIGLEVKQSQNGIACSEHGLGECRGRHAEKKYWAVARSNSTILHCIESLSFRHACSSIVANFCHCCAVLFGALFQHIDLSLRFMFDAYTGILTDTCWEPIE